MTRSAQTDLAGLIGSRICHDLVSPIGAIGNGLELIAMLGPDAANGCEAEMSLISESAAHAAARLRFFRVAFGTSDPEMPISAAEVQRLTREICVAPRPRLDWPLSDALPSTEVQMGFLIYLCFENALPRHSALSLAHRDGRLHGRAEAAPLWLDPALWGVLAGEDPTAALTPARVQFPLLAALARAAGRRIEVEASETELSLTL